MTGSRLVVGGKFTAVNGAARAQLASFDVSTNSLDTWAPAAACSDCSDCNLYRDLVVNGGSVYAASRNAGAATAVDLGTGRLLWKASANGDAQALTLVDGLLYVGGHFTSIKSQPGPPWPRSTSPPGSWTRPSRPGSSGPSPGIWAMASSSTRLYVGGHFSHSGPASKTKRPFLAMFAA